MDYRGQVAFITGGASGAGFGQAVVFGEAGATVVLADIRKDALQEAHAQLQARGIQAHILELDVTDRTAYARAAQELERLCGSPPRLLFNTAGVNAFGPLERSTYEDFDWLLGVNLGGVINGMVSFVPRMIAAGKGGHILTTASIGGFFGSPVASIYSAAKAAVINLMESYRLALAKHHIQVSVLCPANIRSHIAESSRLRPAHLRPSGYDMGEALIQSLRQIHAQGMDPIELARRTRSAMEAGAFYIIPYPEERARLEAHFQEILASVPPLESDLEGARQRLEALQKWIRERQGLT